MPQSDAAASEAVARVGELQRELARREADMNDALAAIKAECEEAAAPLKREVAERTQALKAYCEANRDRLTGSGKVKFYDFPAGKIAWRARPPKVTLRDKVDVILTRIKALGLMQFVRVKHEVDKEAMLAEPDLAATITGVSIGSAGEDFVVEPFEAALAEAAS